MQIWNNWINWNRFKSNWIQLNAWVMDCNHYKLYGGIQRTTKLIENVNNSHFGVVITFNNKWYVTLCHFVFTLSIEIFLPFLKICVHFYTCSFVSSCVFVFPSSSFYLMIIFYSHHFILNKVVISTILAGMQIIDTAIQRKNKKINNNKQRRWQNNCVVAQRVCL